MRVCGAEGLRHRGASPEDVAVFGEALRSSPRATHLHACGDAGGGGQDDDNNDDVSAPSGKFKGISPERPQCTTCTILLCCNTSPFVIPSGADVFVHSLFSTLLLFDAVEGTSAHVRRRTALFTRCGPPSLGPRNRDRPLGWRVARLLLKIGRRVWSRRGQRPQRWRGGLSRVPLRVLMRDV